MAEQALLSYPESQAEGYGFLGLRSFHSPVAVRVWRAGERQFLNVKQLSDAGGYERGSLTINQTRRITKAEWDGFASLLDRSCYWQLPAVSGGMGNDGAQWIPEGAPEGRYHVVDRWTLRSGEFREAGLYLLKLSDLGIELSGKDIY
jgi:hypothetical protein